MSNNTKWLNLNEASKASGHSKPDLKARARRGDVLTRPNPKNAGEIQYEISGLAVIDHYTDDVFSAHSLKFIGFTPLMLEFICPDKNGKLYSRERVLEFLKSKNFGSDTPQKVVFAVNRADEILGKMGEETALDTNP